MNLYGLTFCFHFLYSLTWNFLIFSLSTPLSVNHHRVMFKSNYAIMGSIRNIMGSIRKSDENAMVSKEVYVARQDQCMFLSEENERLKDQLRAKNMLLGLTTRQEPITAESLVLRLQLDVLSRKYADFKQVIEAKHF